MSVPNEPVRNDDVNPAEKMDLNKDSGNTADTAQHPPVPEAPSAPPSYQAPNHGYAPQPAPNYNPNQGQAPQGYPYTVASNRPGGYAVAPAYAAPVQGAGWEKHNLPSTYYGLGAAATILIGFFVGFTFILTPVLSILAIVFGNKEKKEGKDSLLGVILGWVTLAISIIPVILMIILVFGIFALAAAG